MEEREERGETEREREEPEEKPELGERDEEPGEGPWAKFSAGRDPDE